MTDTKILIVEDNDDLLFTLSKVLKKENYTVFSADNALDGLELLKKELIDVVLLDVKLPKMNGLDALSKMMAMDPDLLVIMMTGMTEATPAIEAMKKGAYDYLMKPFELDEMKLVVQKALEIHQMKRMVARMKREKSNHPTNAIFGESKAILDIRNLIKIVAETPRTSILIQGESGTGKELVANAIHECSSRCDQPFIKINCSAIPEHLLESELFGHEKGAFTDAKALKKGLFELANGGTIFLDEIPSMRLNLQPKLLRVIESQTFRRIGGTTDIKIDVRVMAASNVDLLELVNQNEFRSDLYYRLKVMEVTLPSLSERGEDILLLARLFLDHFNKEFNRPIKKMHPETERLLLSYSWPGNIRELKNVMERGVILCQEEVLLPTHLPIELQENTQTVSHPSAFLGKVSLAEMEMCHIREVLNSVNGNKSQAAKILCISRSTLREKLKSYGDDDS